MVDIKFHIVGLMFSCQSDVNDASFENREINRVAIISDFLVRITFPDIVIELIAPMLFWISFYFAAKYFKMFSIRDKMIRLILI